jgi:hypothetical protein
VGTNVSENYTASIFRMEVVYTSKTQVSTYQTTRNHNQEHQNMNLHKRGNLKSRICFHLSLCKLNTEDYTAVRQLCFLYLVFFLAVLVTLMSGRDSHNLPDSIRAKLARIPCLTCRSFNSLEKCILFRIKTNHTDMTCDSVQIQDVLKTGAFK